MRKILGVIVGSAIFIFGGYFLEKLFFTILQIDFMYKILSIIDGIPVLRFFIFLFVVLAIWGSVFSIGLGINLMISNSQTSIVAFSIIALLFMLFLTYSTYLTSGFNALMVDYVIMIAWSIYIMFKFIKTKANASETIYYPKQQ